MGILGDQPDTHGWNYLSICLKAKSSKLKNPVDTGFFYVLKNSKGEPTFQCCGEYTQVIGRGNTIL
jgi:hypothetical protein